MPAPTKISREELEHSPQQLELSDKIFFWLASNARLITTTFVVVFLIYGAYAGYNAWREQTRVAASDLIFSANLAFDKAIESTPWGSEERKQAMTAVRNRCEEVQQKFGSSPIARNALLLKGNTYFFEGDQFGSTANTNEAIKVFGEYKQIVDQSGDAFEKAAARLALGYASENLHLLTFNNREQARAALTAALSLYDEVIAMKDVGFLRLEALNGKARIAAALGSRDEAIKLYKEVFTERFVTQPELGENASQREQMLRQLQGIADRFTVGNTARIGLQRLGVDVEALEKELQAKGTATAETKS